LSRGAFDWRNLRPRSCVPLVAEVVARRAPEIGERNDEILAELEFNAKSIACTRVTPSPVPYDAKRDVALIEKPRAPSAGLTRNPRGGDTTQTADCGTRRCCDSRKVGGIPDTGSSGMFRNLQHRWVKFVTLVRGGEVPVFDVPIVSIERCLDHLK